MDGVALCCFTSGDVDGVALYILLLGGLWIAFLNLSYSWAVDSVALCSLTAGGVDGATLCSLTTGGVDGAGLCTLIP